MQVRAASLAVFKSTGIRGVGQTNEGRRRIARARKFSPQIAPKFPRREPFLELPNTLS